MLGASRRGCAERDTSCSQHEPGWTYQALDTGHDAMITAPGALADILRRLAA